MTVVTTRAATAMATRTPMLRIGLNRRSGNLSGGGADGIVECAEPVPTTLAWIRSLTYRTVTMITPTMAIMPAMRLETPRSFRAVAARTTMSSQRSAWPS